MSQARDYAADGNPAQLHTSPIRPSNTDLEGQPETTAPVAHLDDQKSTKSPTSPDGSIRFRRPGRSNTAKTYNPGRLGGNWRPGQEPGIDVSAPHQGGPGRHSLAELHEQCDITVVDFSQEDMRMYHYDNDSLDQFLNSPRPDWVECRWISINGLSWDVIKMLGNYKHLHRLSIEDLMSPRNRTKADWYSDHTYMVLPLQKLIHLHSDSDCESDCSEWEDVPHKPKKRKKHPFWKRHKKSEKPLEPMDTSAEVHDPMNSFVKAHMAPSTTSSIKKVRTLQRYHGGPNEARILFMEKHSALSSKNLGVGVEQVSIFLTSDNTVLSFFESSAEDIESPIIQRLSTPETILRRSADASMVTQAIIDAIIDLAIPVTTAYSDAIAELELDVLTEADVSHTTSLYVLTSEIVQFRSNISPIVNLVNALRDHKSENILVTTPGLSGKPPKLSSSGVTISPMTNVYLGDVEDHCILITNGLDQMRRAADNMIDLIFNTHSMLVVRLSLRELLINCLQVPARTTNCSN